MNAKIKNLRNIGMSVLAITCLSTTISSTAQAGVYKTISGTSCVGAHANKNDLLTRDSTTGILANADNAGVVYCPLEIDSPTAGLPVQIYLYYTKTTFAGMRCWVRSTEWDRLPNVRTSIPLVKGLNNAFIEVDTMAYGHMVVYCDMADAGDAIQSINYKVN